VTAPVGVEGLEDGAGSAFLVGAAAQEFADQTARVLLDAEFSRRLARQAYEYAAGRNRHIMGQLAEILA